MTLQELLEKIISQGPEILKPSRIAPMRTAVKQYASMLGTDARHCGPETYHLPDGLRQELIENKSDPALGLHALRNLKNNISFLLRTGLQLQYLAPLEPPLKSWHEKRSLGDKSRIYLKRNESPPPMRIGLRPLPARLAHEFQQLSEWSTKPYAPDRPASIKKRPRTMGGWRHAIGHIAGFLVHEQHRDPDLLTLRDLATAGTAQAYISWWISQRGKVTRSVTRPLSILGIIARYWLKDEIAATEIMRIRRMLPAPEAVHDKSTRMLSLPELEVIAKSQYPLNSRRLRESPFARQVQDQKWDQWAPKKYTWRRWALWVEYSLILRLLIRIPFRLRNIVEMQLDRNLRFLPNGHRRPDGTPDGIWHIGFRGEELKVARRGGRENEVQYTWPPDIQPLLEEWLDVWRPKLLRPPGHPFVFVNLMGKPHIREHLCDSIKRTTYKFSGVAVNPHMIRDIWATTFIKSGGKPHVAARRLGNTVEAVLRHYAHLLDGDADREADEWIEARLHQTI